MKKLPLPRLELRWSKPRFNPKTMREDTWTNRTCTYSLVLPISEKDIRSNTKDKIGVLKSKTIVISKTNVSGGCNPYPVKEDGSIDIPYRDGVHIEWDNESLGGHLPMIVICGKKWKLLDKLKTKV